MAKFFTFAFVAAAATVAGASVALAGTTVDAEAKSYLVLGCLVAGAVCLALGFFLIKRGRAARLIAQQSSQWPVADGTVLSAMVATKSHPTVGRYYVPRVRYSYPVGARQYQGDVIAPGIEQFGLGGSVQAQECADRYPVGATVPVHYDPADPNKAMLETNQIGGGRNIVGGVILLLLGVFFTGLAIVIATLVAD